MTKIYIPSVNSNLTGIDAINTGSDSDLIFMYDCDHNYDGNVEINTGAGNDAAVSYTHLTLPTIYSV